MTTNEIADELYHRVYGIRNETRPNGLLSFDANSRSTATRPTAYTILIVSSLHRTRPARKKEKNWRKKFSETTRKIEDKRWKQKKERRNENPKLNWTRTAYSSGPSQRVTLHAYCFKVVFFFFHSCLFAFYFVDFCRYSRVDYRLFYHFILFIICVSWILFLHSLLLLFVRRTSNIKKKNYGTVCTGNRTQHNHNKFQ